VRDGGVVKTGNSSIVSVAHNRMRSLVGKSSSIVSHPWKVLGLSQVT
jgi:hypothetical protein